MEQFPYPPGSYGPQDVVALDGERHLVSSEPRLKEWMESKGLDYYSTYRVTTVTAFNRVIGVVVERFKTKDGRPYVSPFGKVARHLPKFVRA